MHHPQVVIAQIFNGCLKVNIDGHTEPQFFSKMFTADVRLRTS